MNDACIATDAVPGRTCSAPVYPWVPDQRDGRYRNPILAADYSDPDVVRDGDDFYLTASSFNCVPGLPILHSRDLVNWTIVNHALDRLPHPRYDRVQHGCGVWAPAIRQHAGKFWIFFAMPDEGIYVITADHPTGQWSEPHLVVVGRGLIDPCPLWDDDGRAYLVFAYAFSRSGIKSKLRLCPMAQDGSRLLGDGQIIVDGTVDHPTLEGPKFLKKDGYYYILAPAGGVATGWQIVFRSRRIHGPYEEKVVLAQGTTAVNGPHQGALTDTPSGQWWFLHFQESQPFGRIVHLQPVRWEDGWPLMGCNPNAEGVGEPVLECAKPRVADPMAVAIPQDTDDFRAPTLGRQWQWQANPQPTWYSLTQSPGRLRLFAEPTDAHTDLRDAPNLLLQKLQACAQRITTRLRLVPRHALGARAGLVVMGLEHNSLALQSQEGGYELVATVNGREHIVAGIAHPTAELGVVVDATGRCRFTFRADGGTWQLIAGAFQAKEDVWVGAKVGLFSVSDLRKRPAARTAGNDETRGHADFDYFSLGASGLDL